MYKSSAHIRLRLTMFKTILFPVISCYLYWRQGQKCNFCTCLCTVVSAAFIALTKQRKLCVQHCTSRKTLNVLWEHECIILQSRNACPICEKLHNKLNKVFHWRCGWIPLYVCWLRRFVKHKIKFFYVLNISFFLCLHYFASSIKRTIWLVSVTDLVPSRNHYKTAFPSHELQCPKCDFVF